MLVFYCRENEPRFDSLSYTILLSLTSSIIWTQLVFLVNYPFKARCTRNSWGRPRPVTARWNGSMSAWPASLVNATPWWTASIRPGRSSSSWCTPYRRRLGLDASREKVSGWSNDTGTKQSVVQKRRTMLDIPTARLRLPSGHEPVICHYLISVIIWHLSVWIRWKRTAFAVFLLV